VRPHGQRSEQASERATYDVGEGRDGGIARALELECGAQRVAGGHAQHRAPVPVPLAGALHVYVNACLLSVCAGAQVDLEVSNHFSSLTLFHVFVLWK
jgi:hypothetical protein